MLWTTVFDLDGTLIDSHNAVRLAYRLAGVEPPKDFWGKSASDWLPSVCNFDDKLASDVHKRKQEIYLTLLQEDNLVPTLSAADALRTLRLHGRRICVVTAASKEAARAALTRHNIRPDALYASVSRRVRHHTLTKLVGSHAVLVDDAPGACLDHIPTVTYGKWMLPGDVVSAVLDAESRYMERVSE